MPRTKRTPPLLLCMRATYLQWRKNSPSTCPARPRTQPAAAQRPKRNLTPLYFLSRPRSHHPKSCPHSFCAGLSPSCLTVTFLASQHGLLPQTLVLSRHRSLQACLFVPAPPSRRHLPPASMILLWHSLCSRLHSGLCSAVTLGSPSGLRHFPFLLMIKGHLFASDVIPAPQP